MGNFGSLNIAYTGLNAHQKRINVIGENITNVNTPGYHRQRVELSPINHRGLGVYSGTLRAGGGVSGDTVSRIRDEVLADHARVQAGYASARDVEADTLRQLEQAVGGLSPGGLHDQMMELFNGFDDLAANPDDPAMREVILKRADRVAQGFTRTAIALDTQRNRLEDEAIDAVRVINSLTDRIAQADVEILGASTVGANPNTLLDKRDTMIGELAELADVDVIRYENGQVSVSLDGQLLVSNGESNELAISYTADPALTPLGYAGVEVITESGRTLNIASGRLAGQLNALSTQIPDARRDLDAVAADLANRVNTIHQAGVGLDGSTGLDIFEVGPGPGQLQLSADVRDQPEKLGAALPAGGLLDNTNARNLAALADDLAGPLSTFAQAVGTLAAQVATANGNAQTSAAASEQASSLALSTGGVSLDEELTDLITAQRAYEASARVMTAIDQMLQTLVNTGLVGR